MKAKSKKPCYASKGLPNVPGKPRGTDIIPAWLTPGEAVLSPGAAEMLGRGNVQALNQAASTMRPGPPRYMATGGMMDDERRRPPYPDMPTIAQPLPKPPTPASYGAGQQIRESLAGQNERLGKLTAPVETGMNSLAEVYKQTGNVMAAGTQRLANTIDQGQNAVSNFARGAMGLQPSQPAPSAFRPTPANSTPSPATAPLPAPTPEPGTLPMSGGVPYADAESARRADLARAMDPGYVKTPTGTMVTRQTPPEELAKRNAALERLDRQNAATQAQRGTLLGAPSRQPVQQMMQSAQQVMRPQASKPQYADPDLQSFVDGYKAYQGSATRLVDMEDTNMRNYWSAVDDLKSGIGYADDPEVARAYATALGGLSAPNLGGAAASAGMYGSDASRDANRFNTQADYNAKLRELMSGQSLRDAQSQEALARAQNYQSDTNLQNAMTASPERFAGMRRGGSTAGGGLKLEKAITGYDKMGNPIEASGVFNPDTGQFNPLEDAKTAAVKAKIRAANPGIDEAEIDKYLLEMKQNRAGN